MNEKKIPIEILREYEKNKLLRSQQHPSLNLIIWNYTDFTQFKKKWDDITLNCRGLITDTDGKIIARAFRKFFNLGEIEVQLTPLYRIYEKLDGSLGILFFYEGQWVFASRGSFISDQAKKGLEILEERNKNYVDLDKNLSYVFEIIYPENRIIVDYGIRKEVVFLSAFKNDGMEVDVMDDMKNRGFSVVKLLEHHDYEKLKERNIDNEEGYVVLFDNKERVKIKFERYMELHRSVSNLNPNQVLQWFKERKDIEEICSLVPDEFMDWMRSCFKEIQDYYDDYISEMDEKFNLFYTTDSKLFALRVKEAVKSKDLETLLFAKYNGKKNIHELLCKRIENKLKNAEEKEKGKEDKKYMKDPKDKEEDMGKQVSELQLSSNPKLIILVGVSGSGKSTWAKDYIKTNRKAIIISRDNLRKLLFNLENDDLPAYYSQKNNNYKETLVTSFQSTLIRDALEKKITVILDNTNLQKSMINQVLENITKDTDIEIKVFDTPVEECVRRVKNRERKVPESVIRKQHIEFGQVKTNLTFAKHKPIILDLHLPKCVIFDIDGTLALHTTRSPFDETKVLDDIPNEPIVEIYHALEQSGITIILCSGRSENCREDTRLWLEKYNIKFKVLYLRKVGDTRKDYKVKDDIWRSISLEYYISMLFDDRNQVVHHARRIGLNVCQVNEGNF